MLTNIKYKQNNYNEKGRSFKQKEKNLNVVMSNSFGFGGNCSTVIFSKEA